MIICRIIKLIPVGGIIYYFKGNIIDILINNGVIKCLIDYMNCNNEEIVEICLEILNDFCLLSIIINNT